jgi:hypothetical protein
LSAVGYVPQLVISRKRLHSAEASAGLMPALIIAGKNAPKNLLVIVFIDVFWR